MVVFWNIQSNKTVNIHNNIQTVIFTNETVKAIVLPLK